MHCCLRHTCRALLLLENACFACPDNEALLLEVQVRSGMEPLISTAGAWPFASKLCALISGFTTVVRIASQGGASAQLR